MYLLRPGKDVQQIDPEKSNLKLPEWYFSLPPWARVDWLSEKYGWTPSPVHSMLPPTDESDKKNVLSNSCFTCYKPWSNRCKTCLRAFFCDKKCRSACWQHTLACYRVNAALLLDKKNVAYREIFESGLLAEKKRLQYLTWSAGSPQLHASYSVEMNLGYGYTPDPEFQQARNLIFTAVIQIARFVDPVDGQIPAAPTPRQLPYVQRFDQWLLEAYHYMYRSKNPQPLTADRIWNFIPRRFVRPIWERWIPVVTPTPRPALSTPAPTAQTPGLPAPPSSTAETPGLLAPPSSTAETPGVLAPPSSTAQTPRVLAPPSSTAQTPRVLAPPSSTAQTPRVLAPPSSTAPTSDQAREAAPPCGARALEAPPPHRGVAPPGVCAPPPPLPTARQKRPQSSEHWGAPPVPTGNPRNSAPQRGPQGSYDQRHRRESPQNPYDLEPTRRRDYRMTPCANGGRPAFVASPRRTTNADIMRARGTPSVHTAFYEATWRGDPVASSTASNSLPASDAHHDRRTDHAGQPATGSAGPPCVSVPPTGARPGVQGPVVQPDTESGARTVAEAPQQGPRSGLDHDGQQQQQHAEWPKGLFD
jgi:hypothetical protein